MNRASIPPPIPARRTVATRILASFAVTLVAFAITLGYSTLAQKRTAEESKEIADGYVLVALNLGQLRQVQTTISSLVDGLTEQTDTLSIRTVMKSLPQSRLTKIDETHNAILNLREVASEDQTRALANTMNDELEAIRGSLDGESNALDRAFAAVDRNDKNAGNPEILAVSSIEHDASKRFAALEGKVTTKMRELSAAAQARERRSNLVALLLAALTLAVGLVVSIHARNILGPLARVTQRAQAVARGDLTPQKPPDTDDEIGQLAVGFERMVDAVAKAQSRAVANERLAAIGKMAAHVTHEIRNPLSSIGLNIELLEEELAASQVGAESMTLLKAITREVQRLELLSEEYLRVARLPQPRMEADDVAATVRDLVSFAKPEMDRAKIDLRLEAADDLPPALFDEGQIRQALLNVLRNARESMTNGGAIDVSVKAEGMSVVVAVDDQGGGIPEDVRARIFDPFFSTKGEGTGLGLAITRQIIEAHNGTISCDTREGGGTTFRISLPIAPARLSGPLSARVSVA